MINATILFVLVFAGQNSPVLEAAGPDSTAGQPTTSATITKTLAQIGSLKFMMEFVLQKMYAVGGKEDKEEIVRRIQNVWKLDIQTVEYVVHNSVRKEFMDYNKWLTCEDVKKGVLDLMAVKKVQIIGLLSLTNVEAAQALIDGKKDKDNQLEAIARDDLSTRLETAFGDCTTLTGGISTLDEAITSA
ncbi:uncharacterized protein LOC129002862 [Macrosteles quadrilineatus]|uniref:uncharacterized protein LOC129002862 n=1 Tax=Macrosteles quadrilineatus TaxID=74068 RepID=UPI0023E32F64|nr:uncharacterized protein LOC129002862 [Macrosteles quadrilineatus]